MSATTVAGYPAGQCTAYVSSALSWVPKNWGNADQWLTDASNSGFTVINGSNISAVQPGDVAVIAAGAKTAQGTASSDGHVGVVTATNPSAGTVTLESENWPEGDGVANSLTFNASDIEGYVLPPSGVQTTSASSSVPVVSGVVSTADFLGDLVDPTTYITAAWFGAAALLCFMGIRMVFGKSSGAGTVINIGKTLGKLAPEAVAA